MRMVIVTNRNTGYVGLFHWSMHDLSKFLKVADGFPSVNFCIQVLRPEETCE